MKVLFAIAMVLMLPVGAWFIIYEYFIWDKSIISKIVMDVTYTLGWIGLGLVLIFVVYHNRIAIFRRIKEITMSIFDFFKKNKQSEQKDRNSEFEAVLKSLERNEIFMKVNKVAGVTRADESKIGGKPFLPNDFEWPLYTCKDDGVTRPLSFLCQINLSDVKQYDSEGLLPPEGMLYFFYECEAFRWGFDPEDKGAARVFYFENTEGFVPCELPEDLAEDYSMPEIAVMFSGRNSYPKFEELECHSDIECDWEEYDEMLARLGVNIDEDPEDHKLLGYADIIQNEMLTECERVNRGLYCGNPESYRNTPDEVTASIQNEAKNWTLLLQLYTIETDDFEWMFGDCGMIYFYIKREDLAARRFDKAWYAVQCG